MRRASDLRFFSAGLLIATACSSEPKKVPAAAGGQPEQQSAVATAPPPTPRVVLLGNLGTYHRAITTSSREAQQFFDEGLTLLYGFNHEEAFRSFARAAALDTLAPMPHWGMSLALGTNINDIAPTERLKTAYVHLADAVARASHGSAVEQGLIAALRQRYVADPTGDQMLREQSYSDAMRALSKRFSGDADVATLFAESLMNLRPWKLYKADGAEAPETGTIVATLEGVMRRHPTHPGANHYYVHAVEASAHPERAVTAARRLETLVPGAGHLVHMPAHIFIRTGDYARSARANATAASVDEKYFKATGTSGLYSAMYYSHNLQFEAAAAMYAGNFAEALGAARRTTALTEPIADQMVMLEPFAAMELFVLVRFERWPELLAAPAPKATRTLQSALYHWARGAALAGTGKRTDATTELSLLSNAAAGIAADAMVGPANTARDVVAVAKADLTGRLADANGDAAAAIAAFTDAVAAEDRLGYNEPPDWLLPERELLGRALLRTGQFVRAESAFREDLRRNVGNPRAYYGLWQSLAAQKKNAAGARAKFRKAWSGADAGLAWSHTSAPAPSTTAPKPD